MKISYEHVKPDFNSSFRTLHTNVRTSDYLWEYHFHEEIELVCVIAGSGTRHVGFHRSNFTDGDLVLIGSNIPHSGFGQNSTDPHEEIVLQFKQEILHFPIQESEANAIKSLLEQSKYGVHFGNKTKMKILPKLKKIIESNGYERYLILLEILYILSKAEDITLLNKEIMPYKIITKNKLRLQNIFTFVEQNYHREIEIEEAAKLANLTLPAFCNFFKKSTQITFTEFVNRFRISKACMLIIQENTASEVCFQCGFSSVSYFNRMFKKYTLKTPSEYKKQF